MEEGVSCPQFRLYLEADKTYEPLVKEAIRVLTEKLDESLTRTSLDEARS